MTPEEGVPPPPATQAEWDALVAAFEAGTLPWSGWRHPQHLAVTAWYVLRDGAEATAAAMPGRIKAFNAAHGVETTLERGYHETMTRFWLARVAEVLAEGGSALEGHARVQARLGDKQLPFAYYTRERLMSAEARWGWVEPDRRPWDQAASTGYRLFCRRDEPGHLAVHKVYYDATGTPIAMDAASGDVSAESLEELREVHRRMGQAFEQPILDQRDFPDWAVRR